MSLSDTTNATRLDRALRLADLAVNAATVPLPPDAMPSAPPQDIAATDEAKHEQSAETHDPVRQAASAQPADHAHPSRPDADHPTPDALQKSLQAAVHAIHDSLHDGPADTHDGNLQPDFASDISASNPGIAHQGLLSSATAGADSGPTSGHAGPGTVDDALSQPEPSTAGTLAQSQALSTTTLHAAQTTVAALDATAAALVATTHGNPLDAVTIPSLGGSGVDTLAGLLHPAAVPADAAHADPSFAQAHDMPVFAAIGVPEILNGDQELAHATHSPVHLAGSGLI